MNKSLRQRMDECRAYLESGGLGEVAGLADVAWNMGQRKVQMDTDMALTLCEMASEMLASRKAS